MSANPLIVPILDILKSATSKIGEYDLICKLEEQGMEYPVAGDSYNVSVFKKHFMTMNALYHLQQDMFDEGYYLNISALDINICPLTQISSISTLVDDAEQKVRDYYLDWQHFENTTESEVKALLDQFWNQYYAVDKKLDALTVLGLNEKAQWHEIKSSYRRLAADHHPDKGGDSTQFIAIREAYEILKCCKY